MRRRTLCQVAAACAWPLATWGGPPPGATLVWHGEAVAARGADGRLQPVPGAPSAQPVTAGADVWHATRGGLLQHWVWDGEAAVPWRRVAEVRLPAPAHALAAGVHGEVLAAHDTALTLLDVQGHLLRRYEGQDLALSRRDRAAALLPLPHRRSLLAAWPLLREWWEISLDPAAPPVFDGYVHDHRMSEAIASPGHLGVRRVPFDAGAPVAAFAPAGWPWVAAPVGDEVHVVHLDVRRTVARLAAAGAVVSASAVHEDLWWLPVPGELLGVDPRRWVIVQRRPSPGEIAALVVAGGQLHALAGHTVWRASGTTWQAVAHGVGALAANAGGTALLSAPSPWRGVAALATAPR